VSIRELFSGLNDRQRQATETTKGPVLVLAGPGSGKTKVVTSRIAYLLKQGVSPREILAITFTKKAAEEMRTRVSQILGGTPNGINISTFHALGFRILRENAQLAGLEPGFGIISDKARRDIASDTVNQLGDSAKPSEVLQEISAAKSRGLSVQEYSQQDHGDSDRQAFMVDAYQRYETELREQNAVDLDDLILRPLRDVLQSNDSVASGYRRRFSYIMVDEYQDTNGPQFEMTKLIVPSKRNLCVVGDDDQSIYGFRGANVEHILNFADDFPGTRLIKLETNYRSTGHIVGLANDVISFSQKRYPKRLTADQGDGMPATWKVLDDEEEEQQYVASKISEIEDKDSVAVLFRGHATANSMRSYLQTNGIPCRTPRNSRGVHLLTLHASKGLEFQTVFMPALEQDIMPHAYGCQNEERRLFYVGLTRAKRELFLSSCRSRQERSKEPSRFLTDLKDSGRHLQKLNLL